MTLKAVPVPEEAVVMLSVAVFDVPSPEKTYCVFVPAVGLLRVTTHEGLSPE